ncbi:MAG TPA: chemotaxis protein CheB [Gemmatimonadaceae bacterium]|nr:chemotaxis protein CheB [Gemmatimonadaceae bacterium]
MSAYEIAVVGTSWGGLAALRELVAALPAELKMPVVLIQHRHRMSDGALSGLLQDRTKLRVCEVEDKTPIEGGSVYIAPADYHLLIEPGYFTLSVEEPIRYSRPSIDLTFSSAADVFGAKTIGAVLTGANADGSEGLRRIAERGGLALVQEPATAESPTMPSAALKAVPSARVLTIREIGKLIGEMAMLREDPRVVRARRAAHPEANP